MSEIVGYLDYLMNNGERYFPYTRVEGIIDTDGNPFLNWITKMNIHNHDGKYAPLGHNHDTQYATISHGHKSYALVNHTHNYAGSESAGGPATTALALDKEFTLNVTGSETGSVRIKGDNDITLNLSVNHTHDIYLRNDSNNTVVAKSGVTNPLSIVGDGGSVKIDLYRTSGSDRSAIEFTNDSKLRLSYNDATFDVTTDGLFYNSKQLATMEDVLENAGNGGNIDIDVLKGTFSVLGHTHTKSEITDFPSTLPNPFTATFIVNGNSYNYDGSEGLTVILDPNSLGCAPSLHDHDYSSVYATIDHNHNTQYLAIDGSNEYTGINMYMSPLAPTDFTDDGTVPSESTLTTRSFIYTDDFGYKSMIGSTYWYSASSKKSFVNNLFMKLDWGDTVNIFSLTDSGIYYNDNKIIDASMYGHNKGIDADTLDGLHADELPYIKGTEDVINLGKDTKSKIVLDVSDTASTDINIRNANGFIMNINVSETSTDIVLSITSNDTSLFTITKDKSTNQVRTDLFGEIYVNGTKLSV